MFVNIALRGRPVLIQPQHVAAIREAMSGEAGASTVILASGEKLASQFAIDVLAAKLAGEALETTPQPNSEQRAVMGDLYRRLDATA
ncbi:MAG: hypothetical protein ABUS48_00865 [Pseudomonadota bacterium]